ncbi:uncharacterized protein L3040_002740 [Drepanopeziza brunnea f. sp. 'multigermtubi']|uniref:uncharacterized protein n=1 Tax=Drepanopeziza brunnea f. sp. 'multigermtubi' TaxID=698441 RepID=UPI0023998135|nr:hypothetical protein L3040_002740 [Drepanopeziza brunnea f. sp. 'multigermtubi']
MSSAASGSKEKRPSTTEYGRRKAFQEARKAELARKSPSLSPPGSSPEPGSLEFSESHKFHSHDRGDLRALLHEIDKDKYIDRRRLFTTPQDPAGHWRLCCYGDLLNALNDKRTERLGKGHAHIDLTGLVAEINSRLREYHRSGKPIPENVELHDPVGPAVYSHYYPYKFKNLITNPVGYQDCERDLLAYLLGNLKDIGAPGGGMKYTHIGDYLDRVAEEQQWPENLRLKRNYDSGFVARYRCRVLNVASDAQAAGSTGDGGAGGG